MDITRANLEAFFKGLNTTFNRAFDAPLTQNYLKYCMEINSTNAVEVFSFLEQTSGMRKWVGPRQIDQFSGEKMTIVNEKFEKTVAVKRDDLEDDNYGIYSSRIADMSQQAANIWNKLAETAMKANGNWLDGLPFFSNSRKYGENAIVNASTAALSHDSYGTARATMMGYLGHGGDPLEIIPDLLIFGPTLEATASRILNNDLISTTAGTATETNPWKGSAKPLLLPSLTGSRWYLACTSRALKPVCVQKRRLPQFTRLDQASDACVFMNDECLYGTDARGAAFLAVPHLLYCGGMDSVRGVEEPKDKESKKESKKDKKD